MVRSSLIRKKLTLVEIATCCDSLSFVAICCTSRCHSMYNMPVSFKRYNNDDDDNNNNDNNDDDNSNNNHNNNNNSNNNNNDNNNKASKKVLAQLKQAVA